jgi:hypothetical protein
LRTNITLYWDYPAAQASNCTFILRGTTNAASPATNWPIVATVPGYTNHQLTIQPGAYYFVCQASNLWGVSDPSNVASTPAPPRSDYSLGVK